MVGKVGHVALVDFHQNVALSYDWQNGKKATGTGESEVWVPRRPSLACTHLAGQTCAHPRLPPARASFTSPVVVGASSYLSVSQLCAVVWTRYLQESLVLESQASWLDGQTHRPNAPTLVVAARCRTQPIDDGPSQQRRDSTRLALDNDGTSLRSLAPASGQDCSTRVACYRQNRGSGPDTSPCLARPVHRPPMLHRTRWQDSRHWTR